MAILLLAAFLLLGAWLDYKNGLSFVGIALAAIAVVALVAGVVDGLRSWSASRQDRVRELAYNDQIDAEIIFIGLTRRSHARVHGMPIRLRWRRQSAEFVLPSGEKATSASLRAYADDRHTQALEHAKQRLARREAGR